MQRHFKGSGYRGLQRIVMPDSGDLVRFSLLKLSSGETWAGNAGTCEVVLVLLGGKADVVVEGQTFRNLGQRDGVFDGPATAVYIPRDSGYAVRALSESLEAAVCQVEAPKRYSPFVVCPGDVTVNHRGGLSWQRDVHDIIVENGEGKVDRILVGETYSAPGNWSSFPPHKHDQVIPGVETALVEVYHYRVKPENCFGVQLVYSDGADLDEAYLVRNGDTLYIPRGYHPVAAPPTVQLYYLWFLAGTDGRKLVPHDDPDFAALRKLETNAVAD